MGNITKLYAAYKAGFLGKNIIDTYFSFVANIFLENGITLVDEIQIADLFSKRYNFELSMPFLRQILGVGMQNGSFIEDHGKYSVDVNVLAQFKFDTTDFDKYWMNLKTEFQTFCHKISVDIPIEEIDDIILQLLDESDEIILSEDFSTDESGMKPIEYAWYTFVKDCATNDNVLYSFIAAISLSNISKQAIFFSGKGHPDYSSLNIYLDSPMIFALLGMETPEREKAYKKIVEDIQKAGGTVQVLDHNFDEVDGIIASAAVWANHPQYDIRKASNAARFFHDNQMSDEEITEFCDQIETKLNQLGVTKKETTYDIYQKDFQEDSESLYDMVATRYREQGLEISHEKEKTIRIDVRSIIMVYRERQGHVSTTLQQSKHIMLTSNNAIANVSKKYESNRSINSGHVPACVSVDLFGAILWLNSPNNMLEYQRHKLLADCYGFLKPSKKMVEKYLDSLEDARTADKIDEKTYLFLRTHRVVLDSLMDITRGDYARFDSKTYLEVYDDIVEKSRREYLDEKSAHEKTLESLRESEHSREKQAEENQERESALSNRISELENIISERDQKDLEKKISLWGWLFALALFGIPYIVLIALVELLKAQFSTPTFVDILCIAALVVVGIIAVVLFNKGKAWCFKIVRNALTKDKTE